MKANEKAAKPEAEAQTTRHHNLRRHPGCLKNGQHARGSWWLRSECNDPDCAKRTQGWKLAEINAAKRRGLEESGSGSGFD